MVRISEKVYTVTSLTRAIRGLVEDGLPSLWVEGEVSNYKRHSSGHRYFNLKDEGSRIDCVMWRTRRPPGFELEDGALVRAFGKVTVWEKGGRYQLDVVSIMPVGLGALQMAFETLKRKLSEEGLFDAARKRPLPRYPKAVGIVTSPTGAAIRDLVWGFKSRYPAAELFLLPVAVQGEGSSDQIAAGIEIFNRLDLVDVIVIGRGGGSMEDLWAFNEERVVRAVAASRLPVVSAVGHEIDVTLSDLAADLRAPTPTAAAGLVVPDRAEITGELTRRREALVRALERSVSLWRERVSGIAKSYGFQRAVGRVGEERLRLDELARRIESALVRALDVNRQALKALGMRISALSPDAVLGRGYCVAHKSDGTIVRNSEILKVHDELSLKFYRGGAAAVVKEVF